MCFFLWTEPSSFSSGLLKTGMFILSMMRSQTLHNGLKAQCGLAPTYLSTSLISLLLLTNMCCQTPPRITLAAFWLYTPKHPHLRKFIHAICPCLEHSSQSLQILLALSVRITSRVDFLKHIHPVSPVFYFILSTYGSIWSPITSWQMEGETMETVIDYFLGLQKSLWIVTAAIKIKDAYSLEDKLWQT